MGRRRLEPPAPPKIDGEPEEVTLIKLLSYGLMGYNLCGNGKPCKEGAKLIERLTKALVKHGKDSSQYAEARAAVLDHIETERALRKLSDRRDVPAIELLLRGQSPQEVGPENG